LVTAGTRFLDVTSDECMCVVCGVCVHVCMCVCVCGGPSCVAAGGSQAMAGVLAGVRWCFGGWCRWTNQSKSGWLAVVTPSLVARLGQLLAVGRLALALNLSNSRTPSTSQHPATPPHQPASSQPRPSQASPPPASPAIPCSSKGETQILPRTRPFVDCDTCCRVPRVQGLVSISVQDGELAVWSDRTRRGRCSDETTRGRCQTRTRMADWTQG
jgi:hypothetical protein